MLLTSKRRTKKPNVGAQLNQGDWRVKYLRYCFPFNEGGGGYSVGLRNQALPLVTSTIPTDGLIGSSANVTWTPRGCGALAYASSTSSYVDCGQNDNTTGEITWFAHVRPTTLSGLLTIFGQNRAAGDESIESVYLESSKLSWWICHTSITVVQVINGTATLSANTSYRFAGRRSGSSGNWTYTTWINEVQDDSASSSNNPIVYGAAADGNFRIGFAGNYTGAPFVGD